MYYKANCTQNIHMAAKARLIYMAAQARFMYIYKRRLTEYTHQKL